MSEPTPPAGAPLIPPAGDRLAKVIARAGLCSRRDAEGWIKDGRVAVNGKVIRTPAFNVTPRDKVKVDGNPLAAREGTRVWLYHKPAGLVVTEKDPEGRKTIFEALEQEGLPRVLTVGRLDINTEGLLLLTNDGGLKRVLELPATGWLRRYRVRAHGTISQAELDRLKDGVEIDGVKYGPIEATLEREQASNVWLLVGLREGKNREVKNVLASLGLEVNRLIRVSYGPFQLGELAEGAVETVRAKVLRDQLGARLAREAGVDFDSAPAIRRPVAEPEAPPRKDRPGRSVLGRPGGAPPRPARPERDAAPPRPSGKPRKVFFDDGRPPEAFERKSAPERPKRGEAAAAREDRPKRAYRPRAEGASDRPARAFKPRAEAGDRPKRPFKPRAEAAGDRPARTYKPRVEAAGDHPARAFKPRSEAAADRPARAPRPRSDAPAGDRPKRQYKPRTEGAARPARAPAGDRSTAPRKPRPGGARPSDPRPPRPGGARSGGPRPSGNKRPPKP